MPPDRILCDLCNQPIPPHAHYIVRIDVYADPSTPAMTTEELQSLASDASITQLLEELKSASAQELQDQVHRRFQYQICPPCQKKFLANPLGKPRSIPQQGTN